MKEANTMKKYKGHILGFFAFLFTWTVGSAIIGVILAIIFGNLFDKFTGLFGLILGIYFWYLLARKKKEKRVVFAAVKVTSKVKD